MIPHEMESLRLKPIQGLPDKLLRMAREFKKDFGREPEAFILGPHEYFSLCFELAQKPYTQIDVSRIEEPGQFYGIPLQIKASPGIDLGVPFTLRTAVLFEVSKKPGWQG